MSYQEVDGDLIEFALKGNFEVIAHGCNCFCVMGAGIAPLMAEKFGCNRFPLEDIDKKGDINKLGQIDYKKVFEIYVVNAYTQYFYGKNHLNETDQPLDYDALRICLRKINHTFKGKKIGLPQIGCGLAGGDWNIVKSIIQSELKDCDVTIVILKSIKK